MSRLVSEQLFSKGLPTEFVRIEEDEFKAVDFVVMGTAFQIQNDLGRMHGESIYRDELCFRLRQRLRNVQIESPVTISIDSFSKTFFADLVVDSRVIYELKAVRRLGDAHRSQLLQYLLITNLKYGKLVNFRSYKVEGEFVSTQLCIESRQQLDSETDGLIVDSTETRRFVELTTTLLQKWGGFLSAELFYEAVIHFLGGREVVIRPIEIQLAGRTVGKQKAHLLSPVSAFKITTIRKNIDAYRRELQRFLKCTALQKIEWLNMNHHKISYETIRP